MIEATFLARLLDKKSMVTSVGERTKRDVTAALEEVDRQIRQALTGGDIKKGQGVTKSGQED